MITAMAEGDPTKAERKQAKAQRRKLRAGGQNKAERKRARRVASEEVPEASLTDASVEELLESRLARLEEAVAVQSELSKELLEKVDTMLGEGSGSATEANRPQSEVD
jgi:hypothetical protein